MTNEELFTQTYSPRRVAFYLRHFEELTTLAESPSSSRAVFDLLAREWTLLQQEPSFRDCLCVKLNDGVPTRASIGSGGYSAAMEGPSLVRSDLITAANSLPIHWQATWEVFRLQDRLGEWKFRIDIWQRGAQKREQDRWPEPPIDPDDLMHRGSGLVVLRLMAQSLGWQPRDDAVDDVA